MAGRSIFRREFSSASPVRRFLGVGTHTVKTGIRFFATVEKVQSDFNTSQVKEGKLEVDRRPLLQLRLLEARVAALARDTRRALQEIQKDTKVGNIKSDDGVAKDRIYLESDGDEVEPWISYLDEKMSDAKMRDPVSYRLAEIIRETLSTDEWQILEAARQIQTYYHCEYLATQYFPKQASFLGKLYGLVFDTACSIPYAHPLQDTLATLLVELRKLEGMSCKIREVCCSLQQWQVMI